MTKTTSETWTTCSDCSGVTLWPCCVTRAHCACVAGFIQSACRASRASVGRKVFPSLHSMGIQERTWGQHRARNTENQPWQRCSSVEGYMPENHPWQCFGFLFVSGETWRTYVGNVVPLLKVKHRKLPLGITFFFNGKTQWSNLGLFFFFC